MIRKYAEIFCWKNVSTGSFCSAKATHIFSAKIIRILFIESAETVNEMTLNELVKLTTLWTTGPCTFHLKKSILSGAMEWLKASYLFNSFPTRWGIVHKFSFGFLCCLDQFSWQLPFCWSKFLKFNDQKLLHNMHSKYSDIEALANSIDHEQEV